MAVRSVMLCVWLLTVLAGCDRLPWEKGDKTELQQNQAASGAPVEAAAPADSPVSASASVSVPASAPNAQPVDTAQVASMDSSNSLGAAAAGSANLAFYHGPVTPGASVTLSAEVSGKILTLAVKKGDVVDSGQLLLKVDPELLELAQRQALQNVKQARLRVESLEQAIGVERKTLNATLAQAEAGLELAHAQLELVENGATKEEKQQVGAIAKAAQAGRDGAKQEFDRVDALFKVGAATQQQLDNARTMFNTSSAQLEQARSAYRLTVKGSRDENKEAARASVRKAEAMRETALAALDGLKIREKELEVAKVAVALAEIGEENARILRAKATVSIPPGGKFQVAVLYVDEGETVAPSMRLVELVRLDRPYVAIQMPGADVARTNKGDALRVWCVGDAEGSWRKGEVSFIAAQAISMNANIPVEVELTGPAPLPKFGQLCRVEARP